MFVHTAQGTSSSEAVAIENGHAGIEGQLLYLITPAGGSDTVGFSPRLKTPGELPCKKLYIS